MILPGFIKLWWIKPPNSHHSFNGVLALGSVVEPCQRLATALNVYDCRTEFTFYHKLQFDWEKYNFGCEEKGQTRFQSVCINDFHSVYEESIYPFF